MADLAARNVELNALQEKIIVHEGDLCNIREIFPAEFVDLVVSNPPYRPLEQGDLNLLSDVAKARHEGKATPQDCQSGAVLFEISRPFCNGTFARTNR